MDRKRALDLAVTAPAAVLTLPVQAVIALAVWRSMGRPVLFRQEHPGLNGDTFTLLKFRTMREPALGLVDDADRLTRFGRLLRATSLDELPSLWNVLRGDMSLVGPRPLLIRYLPRYSDRAGAPARGPARPDRPRPGLRSQRADLGEQKLDLDVEYVDNRTLRGDLRILATTVGKVLRREGVTGEGSATMTEFMGSSDGEPRMP